MSKDRFIPFETAVTAFVFAVTTADFLYAVPKLAKFFSKITIPESEHSIEADLIIGYAAYLIICWVVMVHLYLIPYTLSIAIANKFKIFHSLYFIGSAIVAALALRELVFNLIPFADVSAPHLAVCGGAGGLVCWLIVRRKTGQQAVSRSGTKVS
jgi:hypothetical protein